jgi:hypothetical protein
MICNSLAYFIRRNCLQSKQSSRHFVIIAAHMDGRILAENVVFLGKETMLVTTTQVPRMGIALVLLNIEANTGPKPGNPRRRG